MSAVGVVNKKETKKNILLKLMIVKGVGSEMMGRGHWKLEEDFFLFTLNQLR